MELRAAAPAPLSGRGEVSFARRDVGDDIQLFVQRSYDDGDDITGGGSEGPTIPLAAVEVAFDGVAVGKLTGGKRVLRRRPI